MRAFILAMFLIGCVGAPLCAQIPVGRNAPNFGFSKTWNLAAGFNELDSLNGRPVLVEFWATWCGPCVKNVPHMNSLQDAFGQQGLTIVAVSDEKASVIDSFVRSHGLRYPVVQAANAGGLYQVSSIPAAFLVDTRGKVIWQGHPAALSHEDIERMLGLKATRASILVPSGAEAGAEGTSGVMWVALIGVLGLLMVGALGWFWWKTSDHARRPKQTLSLPAYGAVAASPGAGSPPGPAAPVPGGPAAVVATAQRPASSTAVAPLLTDAGKGPSSGATRAIKLTPSGRFPTVPYAPAPGALQPELEPEEHLDASPDQTPLLQPDMDAPAIPPPGKPVQFRPFNAGGRQA